MGYCMNPENYEGAIENHSYYESGCRNGKQEVINYLRELGHIKIADEIGLKFFPAEANKKMATSLLEEFNKRVAK